MTQLSNASPGQFWPSQNPVLIRELLANLRTSRSFALLAIYQLTLAAIAYFAWPTVAPGESIDFQTVSARRVVDLFFLGQFIVASMIAPSLAAGTISGEKERQTYEMLLASPLRPGGIVAGKWLASLTHLLLLVVASVPIVILMLPLGGVSIYEIAAAYVALLMSLLLFGSIGVLCSGRFAKTSHALAVSYLCILPLVLAEWLLWQSMATDGAMRIKCALVLLPAAVTIAVVLMLSMTAGRMLYPPDLSSGGRDVIDLETEARQAIGLVIQPDQFPDRLFAPPRQEGYMPDGTNPVYHKELHGEIFSQGTLMLRLVIQISMLLAIPLMGTLLFWQTGYAVWFSIYVIAFNLMITPVFLSGTMTSERERQTLDLLLTTTLPPWRIVWGKWIVGARISIVLTGFISFSMLLGVTLNETFWSNLPLVAGMFAIPAMVCLVNAAVSITVSLVAHRSVVALLISYGVLMMLYFLPAMLAAFTRPMTVGTPAAAAIRWSGVTSPISALFSLPMRGEILRSDPEAVFAGDPAVAWGYLLFSLLLLVGCGVVVAHQTRRLKMQT